MKKIINIIPVLLMGLLCQMLMISAANAESASDKADLQQLEQLQMSMAKHTQDLAQADPRMGIFSAMGAAAGAAANSGAGSTPAPANAPPPPQAAAATPAPVVPPPNIPNMAPPVLDVSQQPGEANEAMNEAAFRQVIRGMMPLLPSQVKELKKAYVEDRMAAQSPAVTPPKPVATTQFINLAPGATPPVVRLAKGFVSSLLFIDSTGAPWNIESYDIGDPGSFNISWDKKSNTLMMQSSRYYTYGNMAIKLWGLNTPIMLTLVPGQKVVDYRVDFRVPGVGPNAQAPVATVISANGASDDLLSVLNGVPPADVMEVIVSGGQAQAWVRGTTMFVRTEAQLLSPGWITSMRSADGMNAYELPVTPRLLMSVRGKIIQYKVEGL